jgi:uncharacterized membrane protein YccC
MFLVILLLLIIVAILLFGAAAVRGVLGTIFATIAIFVGLAICLFLVSLTFDWLKIDVFYVLIAVAIIAFAIATIQSISKYFQDNKTEEGAENNQHLFLNDRANDPEHDMAVRARRRRRLRKKK